MRKAPLLAALPLIIGCDDGAQIKTRLNGAAVQAITAELQNQCLRVIRDGTVRMSSALNGDFKATLPVEECTCENRPPHFCDYTIFYGSFDDPNPARIFVISAVTSALVNDEDQGLKIDVTINDGQECVVEETHPDGRTDSLRSEEGYALEACRAFIKRVQDTVAAIRQRARRVRSKCHP